MVFTTQSSLDFGRPIIASSNPERFEEQCSVNPNQKCCFHNFPHRDNQSPDFLGLIRCHTWIHFLFQGKFHETKCETLMIFVITLAVDNVFMERFDTVALECSSLKPKIWFRDVLWFHERNTFDPFLNYLNEYLDMNLLNIIRRSLQENGYKK